jgi:hypothetical protein
VLIFLLNSRTVFKGAGTVDIRDQREINGLSRPGPGNGRRRYKKKPSSRKSENEGIQHYRADSARVLASSFSLTEKLIP